MMSEECAKSTQLARVGGTFCGKCDASFPLSKLFRVCGRTSFADAKKNRAGPPASPSFERADARTVRSVARTATMGRMHTPGKGMSGSALPYKRSSPSWLKITSAEIGDIIAKLAKKGMTPSQIGVLLRDNHGVAQVSSVTNSKILRILKGQGLAPTLPEDLYCLIKKAVSVRKHMERNRKDMDSKFRLILIESRIHRLARYYKLAKKLAPNWKYDSATASTLVA